MQDFRKLTRGRNSATPANTEGRGRLLRTPRASCGARLRRSITSGGAASTTGPETTADALPTRLNPCANMAVFWNTRQKPEHGRRMDLPRPLELAGSAASMAGGCARCGKAPTDTERRKQRGSTTTAQSRRCNCAGTGRTARTRLDFMISEGRRRTSRHSGNGRRMQPRWRFEMNCYGWRCIPPHNVEAQARAEAGEAAVANRLERSVRRIGEYE